MKRVAVFNELDENQLNLLKPLFEHFSCRAGEVVFQQGAPAEYLYAVVSGMVDMSFKPHDGSAMTISHVGKGNFFGWSAVVGSEKYTSSAIAIEDVEAFRIHGDDLRTFCVEHPEMGQYILESLADGVSTRWKDAHKQVKAILFEAMKK